jgi:hypothetical protein
MAKNETVYDFKNPDFDPYIESEFTWIRIASYEVKVFTAFGRSDTGGMEVGDEEESWLYLAPLQIMESINNTWEPWETIATRLAGKFNEYKQIVNDVQGIGDALRDWKKGGDVGSAFRGLSGTHKKKGKVDTPIVYENTERREFTLMFNLVANSEDLANEMLWGLRVMQAYTLPIQDGLLGIELPHVFSVKSLPLDDFDEHGLIDLDYAAITSFQPTFMAPYINGRPSRVELTITFKELPPLYFDSIQMAG